MLKTFEVKNLRKLFVPGVTTKNGQVTIIGGSELFHGAPLLSLKVASRIVDMVFFASPEPSVGRVAERIKSKLFSFIWVPWDEIDSYIEKSDSILIGPGFMRFSHESQITNHQSLSINDEAARRTRDVTKRLLTEFPNKHWVIDAGSLQVMDPGWIPESSILTPNEKEFEMLFGVRVEESFDKAQDKQDSRRVEVTSDLAKKYNCIINAKGLTNIVCSPKECVKISGGNPGLTKGGVGDVLAGLTVALLAKNEPFLAASAASYITKTTADELYKKAGSNYSSDDLADKIPGHLNRFLS